MPYMRAAWKRLRPRHETLESRMTRKCHVRFGGGRSEQCLPGNSPAAYPTVGHLVGEGVFEGVFELGEEAGLVEELGGLQVAEPTTQLLLGQLPDGLQEGEGHLSADDRGGLKESLLLGR
jgi:hypothetical protein